MANRLSALLVVGLAVGFAGCGGDSITLPPTTGTLEVTTTTGGTEPDPDGYTIQVDAQAAQAIGTAATVSVPELTPGAHSVLLGGMAPNCVVEGENPRSVTIVAGETVPAAFALNCGGTTGALEITTQTTGPAPDADGYAVSFDGSDRGPVGANATATFSGLPPGSHVVGLTGVAANCQVQGDNLRAVTITTGQTATLTFAINCEQPPPIVGVLRITTTTTGSDQDADGYRFAVDGAEPQPIGINATTDLANTAVGPHTVVLSNVAGNCTVDDQSQSTVVTPGGTATVAFNITCGATTGSIRVTTTTSGDNPDSDGYQFTIDDGPPQSIPSTGVQTVGNIPAGSRRVELSGVAGNCSVDDASKRVTVAAGATSDVGFSVTCAKASTTTTITSDDPDPSTTGQAVTVSVTVSSSAGTPTGTVDITVRDQPATCSITLSGGSGSCQLTDLATGDDQTIFANYRGDAQFAPSDDEEQHRVDPPPSQDAAPTAVDDPGYATTRDIPLSVTESGSLLKDNDNPNDQDALFVLPEGPRPTDLGGTVTIGEDGSFTYAPPPGVTGQDTFEYTVSDRPPGQAGRTDIGRATVTINP